DVLKKFAGKEIFEYFKALSNGKIRTAMKPQYVDKIKNIYKGEARKLLKKIDERNAVEDFSKALDIDVRKEIEKMSGGELQRLAILSTSIKNADIYFFDEPSSYLDIYQRLRVAKFLDELCKEAMVVVIEHDLAILDFLATKIHLIYGEEGAYGVISNVRTNRNAINTYLDGYMKEENIRVRDWKIEFEVRPPRREWVGDELISFDGIEKSYENFFLKVSKGRIRKGEVVGVVGPNAIGKTTFVKILSGEIKPTKGNIKKSVSISYKPQHIKLSGIVSQLFSDLKDDFFIAEIKNNLGIKSFYERDVDSLSGGELQRVAVALALAKEADIYLIDEPSAYLDSNQRMICAKTIRRVIEKRNSCGMIVDHDVYFIDLVSDSLMVFSGTPSSEGYGYGPFDLREGMNRFLSGVGITFRRDNETNRPRINKPNSKLDREQKEKGEYYYL
ncbi:MAG: ribosome biogenesis/translation initiation ATPase RLI, partial [Candidatus Thermoplasmatota archaeon]